MWQSYSRSGDGVVPSFPVKRWNIKTQREKHQVGPDLSKSFPPRELVHFNNQQSLHFNFLCTESQKYCGHLCVITPEHTHGVVIMSSALIGPSIWREKKTLLFLKCILKLVLSSSSVSSAVLEEVLAAQKDRDQAVMSRLLLANEERDEALLRLHRLQQAAE